MAHRCGHLVHGWIGGWGGGRLECTATEDVRARMLDVSYSPAQTAALEYERDASAAIRPSAIEKARKP